jgi:hypothetical protein
MAEAKAAEAAPTTLPITTKPAAPSPSDPNISYITWGNNTSNPITVYFVGDDGKETQNLEIAKMLLLEKEKIPTG